MHCLKLRKKFGENEAKLVHHLQRCMAVHCDGTALLENNLSSAVCFMMNSETGSACNQVCKCTPYHRQ